MNARAPRHLSLAGRAIHDDLVAAPPPASDAASNASIHELARAWLADNDGIGLSIGIYDEGQRRFYNFGTTQLDGNILPTKDTIYEIGSIAKTMTGQLLARAVVEGRAALDDDVAKYLDEPYPNLENGGERVRLMHLANMTSQLVDNIPDITQVRPVRGEPLAVTRMGVFERLHARQNSCASCTCGAAARRRASDPAHSNVASMLLGVVLEKIYGEPFDSHPDARDRKAAAHGEWHRAARKTIRAGLHGGQRGAAAVRRADEYASGSLRYSAEDLLRYASWQMVERDASVKLAHQPTWITPDSASRSRSTGSCG